MKGFLGMEKTDNSGEGFNIDILDESLSTYLDKIETLVKSGSASSVTGLIMSLRRVHHYFYLREKALGGKAINTLSLINMMEDVIGPKIDTIRIHANCGRVIAGLIRFGSSKNQAISAVGRWLNIKSNATLITAYNEYAGIYSSVHGDVAETDDNRFIYLEHEYIMNFIGNNYPEKFPEGFSKATPAFIKLIDACNAETERKQASSVLELYTNPII